MNTAIFGKIMENLRKYSDIKLVTEHLLAIEMKKKTDILTNKPVYLGLSISELSKILMYEF